MYLNLKPICVPQPRYTPFGKQDYRPEKACYQAVASAALQSGDTEASAKFLEAAENAPPATMAVNTASDSGEEVVAFVGREGGVLDGDANGRDGGGGGDASLRQQRIPPVIPGARAFVCFFFFLGDRHFFVFFCRRHLRHPTPRPYA